MKRGDLPEGFPYDNGNGWLDAVEFEKLASLAQIEDLRQQEEVERRKIQRTKAAQELGVPPEFVAFLDTLPPKDRQTALTQMVQLYKKERERAKFPERPVLNAEARAEQVAEQAHSAPRRGRDVRERTVIVGGEEAHHAAKNYLRELYTSSNGQMLCQICQEVMPFKLADGHYYFEAVAIDPRVLKEHKESHLALCPNCAAKYKHALGTRYGDLRRILESERLVASLILAQKEEEIRFVQAHKHDLNALFSALSKQAKSNT
jgi:hypothetical protein